MKSIKLFFLLLVGIASFTACNDANDECPVNPLNKDTEAQAQFYGNIDELKTRASGTSWDNDDAIGIYALNEGQTLADASIYDSKSNIEYRTASADGKFEPLNANEAIKLPGSGDKLDFVAYYPYYQTITADFKYEIDLSNQSSLPVIDLLYAQKKSVDKNVDPIKLQFKHTLSRVIIALTTTESISLDNATVKIKNITTDGSLNLVDGTVNAGTSTADVALEFDNTAKTATAILMPGQDMSAVTFVVTLKDGKEYNFTPATTTLAQNTSSKYTLTLTSGSVTGKIEGTIEDWGAGTEVNSTVNPNNTTPPATPSISLDNQNVNFTAVSGTSNIQITASTTTLTWTVSSNQTWLTVNPVNGTGNGSITLSAEENTTTTERTAVVTVTPTGGTATTVTVKQVAGAGTGTTNLLFPGSDFEDWSAFEVLIDNDAKGYAAKTKDSRTGSNALSLQTTTNGNDYIFKATVPAGFTAPTKTISFFVKGTSSAKSLSVNVYKDGGYYKFNVGDITTSDVVINPATGHNSYTGTIDTQNQWVKVTLDVSSITDMQTTQGESLFALKIGKQSDVNLIIDDITFE